MYKVLPIDIINYIIPYTYNIQKKELLIDIKNYNNTKTKLYNTYYNYYIVELGEEEPEDKNWIINDLFRYLNNYQVLETKYSKYTYDIFTRNTYIVNIEKYMENFEKKTVNTQINIIWGLFTIEERNLFCNNSYNLAV